MTAQRGLPAIRSLQRPSMIDLAENELRNAMYRGDMRSGESIPEVYVSREMGISRSSLREACQRLVREGLLTQIPGRGMFVVTLTHRDVDDLAGFRLAVELAAVRLTAQRVGVLLRDGDTAAAAAVIRPMREALRTSEQAIRSEDALAIGDADLDLHFRIADAAQNRYVRESMSTIMLRTRVASMADPDGYVVRTDVLAMHEVIVDALGHGDAQTAVRAMKAVLLDRPHPVQRDTDAVDDAVLLRDTEVTAPGEPVWPDLGRSDTPLS